MKGSRISWCDNTFNPVIGCSKISPGCDNCYAEHSTPARAMKIGWGNDEPRHRTSEEYWQEARNWNKLALQTEAQYPGSRRPRVFCGSLCDWLDRIIDPEVHCDLFQLVAETPGLDWLMLTKRVSNWRGICKRVQMNDNAAPTARVMAAQWLQGLPPSNVWMGATIESETYAYRAAELAEIPARVRFISNEPALGDIDWQSMFCNLRGDTLPLPDWIIIGGESGLPLPVVPKWRQPDKTYARPFNLEQAANLLEACRHEKAENGWSPKVYVKQMGSTAYLNGQRFHTCDRKGGAPREWPTRLNVQEFPGLPTTNVV